MPLRCRRFFPALALLAAVSARAGDIEALKAQQLSALDQTSAAPLPDPAPPEPAAASAADEAAVPVKLSRRTDGAWELTRGGAPYFVRGGAGSPNHVDQIARYGGNSIRTWGTETLADLLPQAQAHGLTVLAGIWLPHKEEGFDYANADSVSQLQQTVLADVVKYKDSPALLAWGLGNEEEAGNDAPELWRAIESMARAIKAADPNHPIVTVVQEIGTDKLAHIQSLAPDVDILGVNSYESLPSLKQRLADAGWDKPYLVTEFGPRGPWASEKTSWGAPVEPTSTQKAAVYREGYLASVAGNAGRCLGSYAFLWGHKFEGTETWFGMLLPDDTATLAAVDAVSELWTGAPPAGAAPEIEPLDFAQARGKVAPGRALSACARARGTAADSLTLRWRLVWDADGNPDRLPSLLIRRREGCVDFSAPADPGPYRLYVEALDGAGRAATANAPFFVDAAR
jgi:hypothetical protein